MAGSPRTPVERWTSPAARTLCSALLVVAVGTRPHSPASQLAALAVTAGALALTRPNPRLLLRHALIPLTMIAGLIAPLLLAGDLRRALQVGERATLAVTIALAFSQALSLAEIPGALRSLGAPAPFAAVLATMSRQISTLTERGRRIVLARRLRGARGLSASGDAVAALLHVSTLRAERIELAMQLRGYDPAAAAGRCRLRWTDAPVLGSALGCALLCHLAPWLTAPTGWP